MNVPFFSYCIENQLPRHQFIYFVVDVYVQFALNISLVESHVYYLLKESPCTSVFRSLTYPCVWGLQLKNIYCFMAFWNSESSPHSKTRISNYLYSNFTYLCFSAYKPLPHSLKIESEVKFQICSLKKEPSISVCLPLKMSADWGIEEKIHFIPERSFLRRLSVFYFHLIS